MAAFGARDADITRANEIRADGACEVYPENWEAVAVFLSLATQWRVVGLSTMAGARLVQTGLEYTAVEPVMRLMRIKPRRRAAIFKKLQIMEHAALDVLLAS